MKTLIDHITEKLKINKNFKPVDGSNEFDEVNDKVCKFINDEYDNYIVNDINDPKDIWYSIHRVLCLSGFLYPEINRYDKIC